MFRRRDANLVPTPRQAWHWACCCVLLLAFLCRAAAAAAAPTPAKSLNFHNLLNAKPNLGDIGYIGYAQLNQAGSPIPQVATLQPLTTTLQYTRSF